MMATQAKIAMRAVRTLSGNPIPKLSVPEKASSTFKKGAVCFANAGYLDECGANPALILGLATQDAGNGASDGLNSQVVELAHVDTLFRGYLDTGASEGTGTAAATARLKAHGVTKAAAGGVWFVDSNKTGTSGRVVVWEAWSESGYTDLGGADIRPHVVFSFTQFTIASSNGAFQGSLGS
jgi:hypothetical protein